MTAEVLAAVRLIGSFVVSDQENGLRRLINLCLNENHRRAFDRVPRGIEVIQARMMTSQSEVVVMLSLWALSHLALDASRCPAIGTQAVVRFARGVILNSVNSDLVEKSLWLLHNLTHNDSCLTLISEEEGTIDIIVALIESQIPRLRASAMNTMRNLLSASPNPVVARNQSRFCHLRGFLVVLSILNCPESHPPDVVSAATSLLFVLANPGPSTEPVMRKILVVSGALTTLAPLVSSEDQGIRERALVILASLSGVVGLERFFLDAGVITLVAEILMSAAMPASSRSAAAVLLKNVSSSADVLATLAFSGLSAALAKILDTEHDVRPLVPIVSLVSVIAKDETLRLELLAVRTVDRLRAVADRAHSAPPEVSAKLMPLLDAAVAVLAVPVSSAKRTEVLSNAMARLKALSSAGDVDFDTEPQSPQPRIGSLVTVTSPKQSAASAPSATAAGGEASKKGWTFATAQKKTQGSALLSPLNSSRGTLPSAPVPVPARPQVTTDAPSASQPLQGSSPVQPSPPSQRSLQPPQATTPTLSGSATSPTMERGFRNRSSQQPGNDPDLEGKLKKIAKLNGIQQKRSHIAKEILTTERSYVHNLETCLKNHVKVLSEPGSIVGPDIASALFGNMEEVYLLNSGFLMALEEHMKDWGPETQLGELFSSFWKADMERIYSKYINNFDSALALYYKLIEENTQFKEFVQTSQRQHTLDMASFMVMPVQRIPRYILLLKSLLQRTPAMHPDGSGLHRALVEAKQLTDKINEQKRMSENQRKVLELEQMIEGLPHGMKLEAPDRSFVRQALFLEVDAIKGSVYRFVIMLSDIILFTSQLKKKIQVDRIVAVKDVHAEALPQPTLADDQTPTNAFRLTTPEGPLVLSSSSLVERDEWVAGINSTP